MAMKEKNVQIPKSLFDDITDFLFFRFKLGELLEGKYWGQFDRICNALSEKQDKLMSHNAYSVMVTTKNQDELERARFNYQYYKGD